MKTMKIAEAKPAGAKRWYASCPGGGQEAGAVIASSGIPFHLWRLYQHFWLACLLFPVVSLVRSPAPPAHLAIGVWALVFFAASYTWLMWRHPIERGAHTRDRPALQRALFTVLVALALALNLMYGLSFLWLFIGVAAIAGVLFPLRSAFVVVTLLMFLPPVISVVMNGGVKGIDWPLTIALLLLVRGLGLDMVGLVRLSSTIRELHTERRELARLKVEEERLRLARDLHDLLGQTLSMITLKSELAKHLIAESPERCAQELSEIERVARQTLREVREAVADYRQPRLESELEGARQLLSAAGIDYQIQPNTLVLPPETSAVLAWTVREGVTNVIRHSRARHCEITLIQGNGTVGAAVINDGGREAHAESPSGRPGLGLAGLRERVSALGGRMEAGPLTLSGKEHFRVRVELPIHLGVEAPVLQEECS